MLTATFDKGRRASLILLLDERVKANTPKPGEEEEEEEVQSAIAPPSRPNAAGDPAAMAVDAEVAIGLAKTLGSLYFSFLNMIVVLLPFVALGVGALACVWHVVLPGSPSAVAHVSVVKGSTADGTLWQIKKRSWTGS